MALFNRLWKENDLFGHVCRMKDDRLIQIVLFSIMSGPSKRHNSRTDDLEDWCYSYLCAVIDWQ